MNEDALAKRELIRNVMLAATSAGLSMALAQQAMAQAPGPTAGPPTVIYPSGPTTQPPAVVPAPSSVDRGAIAPRPAASEPKKAR